MTIVARIEERNGRYEASLIGWPEVKASAADRASAIAALRSQVRERVDRGDIIEMELDAGGIMSLAGKYADDPTLREMCEDIYRERDRERRHSCERMAQAENPYRHS